MGHDVNVGHEGCAARASRGVRSARTIALIGPFATGKTSLLEAVLARTGAVARAGNVTAGTSVGDASAEARNHAMSVALNVSDTMFLGDKFTFLDCPGSVEFISESIPALRICDAAIVVIDPDPKRLATLQIILKELEDNDIPHLIFLNKIDSCATPVRQIIPMLQPASARPLVLRQIPIWQNGIATGFVDLASRRAYVYREHLPSEIIELPDALDEPEADARYEMLEKLADYDDQLMEQILSDIPPPQDRVFDDLTREMRDGLICPVLIGSALRGNGILRLMKALRHEAPNVADTAKRIGVEANGLSAFIIKTLHSKSSGKLSIARVLGGSLHDGATIATADGRSERIAGMFTLKGEDTIKCTSAEAGDVVALGRLDSIRTADTIGLEKTPITAIPCAAPPAPVLAAGLVLRDRKDEVKLSAALLKLRDEDPSFVIEHASGSSQIVLHGQGEMHLRVAVERLQRRFGLTVTTEPRRIAYKETIRAATHVHARHKKQSGGHGQFGDVQIDIAPLPRGRGIVFADTVTGGTVPKQYIPSVEIGVRDYLQCGPLGFPVVDVAVTLTDGSYHSVDSSDMAFRQAGRMAMSEGLPRCTPVLLEPVLAVDIAVPSDATARVNALVSQRRGQILGFDGRDGWPGWDVVSAHIPEAEMEGLIVDVRSATSGAGTFSARYDHLAELNGRMRDKVVAEAGHAKDMALLKSA